MAGMRQETAIDGFRLAYERTGRIGAGPAVLLHGWPGDRTDYREVVPLVSAAADVIVPDLRGFGESDKHEADPARQYNATAQARSVIGLIDELALGRPVIAGYDIGSRIAQAIARDRPDLVRALVIAPPLPGIGDRILAPRAQREFWYQAFHNPELVHRTGRWPAGRRPRVPAALLVALVRARLRTVQRSPRSPGSRSTGRRARSPPRSPGTGRVRGRSPPPWPSRFPRRIDRIAVPATVLWPEYDPLFPREWSDRIGEFFAAAELAWLDGVGHFSPLEAPDEFAAAILAAVRTSPY